MTQTTSNMNNAKFRYTLDNNFLSQDQREFYEENGFLVVRDLVPQPLLDLWRDSFVDICEGRRDKGMMTLMKEMSLLKSGLTGQSIVYKLQDFVWDEDFFQYISYPKLMKYVECFTGPNVMAVHTMLINKPPDSGAKSTHIHYIRTCITFHSGLLIVLYVLGLQWRLVISRMVVLL